MQTSTAVAAAAANANASPLIANIGGDNSAFHVPFTSFTNSSIPPYDHFGDNSTYDFSTGFATPMVKVEAGTPPDSQQSIETFLFLE